jgi:SNF2 family DNA or RNA helicase
MELIIMMYPPNMPLYVRNIIENNFNRRDLLIARRYPKDDIILEERINTTLSFRIKDYFAGNYYQVKITKKPDNLSGQCSCYEFRSRRTCNHIPAIMLNYYEEIFKLKEENSLTKSKRILKQFSKKQDVPTIKKELSLEISLEVIEDFDYNEYEWCKKLKAHLKVGYDKTYVLTGRKLKDILLALDNHQEVVIGKQFTFDTNKYYFNKNDLKIINYFKKNIYDSASKITIIDDAEEFISLLKEKRFSISGYGFIDEIVEGIPFQTKLTQTKNHYHLKIIKEGLEDLLDNNHYFINIKNTNYKKLYHLNIESQSLMETIDNENLKELEFEEEDLDYFSSGLLPMLKDNMEIEENLQNKFSLVKPIVKLYFDLYRNYVTCKLIFSYNNKEVNYFSKNTQEVLRDFDYENEVLKDLIDIGFILDVKKEEIILDDIDKIVLLLEEELNNLAEKYETYTSEKLKKVNVINSNPYQTSFSIGEDNILHYDFSLGEVSNKDLEDILANLKVKKKYYRLKNGNILNLEDKKLQELSNLIEDMDITTKELSGEIPKYRAIYLDSIKNNKYSIIKTNNLFDNFINRFNEYKNSTLTFTKEELKILRDYQVTGIQWLYNIHKCDLGGILADEMGLGKSIQVIYLIKKLLEEDKNNKFLIVVPTSLVYNWDNEFKKFAPNIPYQLFVGPKDTRHKNLEESKVNVYITSYGLLREDISYYDKLSFTICILDEAQNIKNPQAGITKTVKKIKSETHLALTGTPIENSVLELWSIFDFLMPGFLSNESKFLSRYKVTDINEESSNRLSLLNQLITPFILRRKKKDVIKDLPEKINNNIFIDLSEKEKKLYASVVKDARDEMDRLIDKDGYQKAKFMILVLLTRLRQLCIDPKLVFDDKTLPSSKIENLIKVVKEVIENGHKILLFTSFKSALEIVKKELNKEKITNYTIDGSVSSKKRMELVNKFNQDDTNVFLIMLKSGGTGLNLTSADVVIHLDLWWNPQAENQATDRAHRIGQKNTVEVIKLITKGTIEEKILELQDKKKILSDKLIEGEGRDQSILDQLSEKELRNLFAFENKED